MARKPPDDFFELWQRQRDEPSDAFAAFVVFRDQMWKRTLANTMKQFFRDELYPQGYKDDSGRFIEGEPDYKAFDRCTKIVRKWAEKYTWADRAVAYDRYLDDVACEATKQELKDMKKRHVRMSQIVSGKAFQAFVAKAEDPESMQNASYEKLLELMERGIALERKAQELPDFTSQVNMHGQTKHSHVHTPEFSVNQIAGFLQGVVQQVDGNPSGFNMDDMAYPLSEEKRNAYTHPPQAQIIAPKKTRKKKP